MQYEIETVENVETLHPNTLRRLRKMTARGPHFGMKVLLREIFGAYDKDDEYPTRKAFVARDSHGKIIAWAMLTTIGGSWSQGGKVTEDVAFHVFVSRKYRKMGIATELFNVASASTKSKHEISLASSYEKTSDPFHVALVRNASMAQKNKFSEGTRQQFSVR